MRCRKAHRLNARRFTYETVLELTGGLSATALAFLVSATHAFGIQIDCEDLFSTLIALHFSFRPHAIIGYYLNLGMDDGNYVRLHAQALASSSWF
jgi:hypothetical protein